MLKPYVKVLIWISVLFLTVNYCVIFEYILNGEHLTENVGATSKYAPTFRLSAVEATVLNNSEYESSINTSVDVKQVSDNTRKSMTNNRRQQLLETRSHTQEGISASLDNNRFLAEATQLMNEWNFDWLINRQIDRCTKGQGNHTVVLLFVHSSPVLFTERELIRKSWAAEKSYQDFTFVTVFMLGKVQNESVQDQVRLESEKNGDIVQTNVMDSYRNLTYKHILAFRWIIDFCPMAKFIVKLDDDTLVNIYKLADFLQLKSSQTSDFLYCSVFKNIGPRRDIKDKWFVSRGEYPYKLYPPYCEGFAYVTTRSLLPRLYNISRYTPFYWIDDVYVTGFLVHKLKIVHEQLNVPYNYVILHSKSAITDQKVLHKTLFILAKYQKNSHTWMKTWHAIQGPKKKY